MKLKQVRRRSWGGGATIYIYIYMRGVQYKFGRRTGIRVNLRPLAPEAIQSDARRQLVKTQEEINPLSHLGEK